MIGTASRNSEREIDPSRSRGSKPRRAGGLGMVLEPSRFSADPNIGLVFDVRAILITVIPGEQCVQRTRCEVKGTQVDRLVSLFPTGSP